MAALTARLNTIHLFLASPGGLDDEREAVDQVVTRVNRTAGRALGWHIELLRWEDRQPDAGRPQTSINEDLDRADLFIGLLGSRWGTATGEYTSGFEEEFERSLEKWRANGTPRLWLYFKEVPAAQLADPGASLRQVLTFRDRVREQQIALYNKFANVGDLRELVFERLVTHLAELGATAREGTPDDASSASGTASNPRAGERSASGAASAGVQEAGTAPTDEDLLGTIDRARAAVSDGTSPRREDDTDDMATIARMFLLGAAWMSSTNQGRLTLQTHQAVTVYENCRGMVPTISETIVLLSTLLADDDPVRPAWALLRRGFSPRQLLRIVGELMILSGEPDVRAAALRMLRRTEEAEALDHDRLDDLAADRSEGVRAELYKLLAASAAADSPQLMAAAEHERSAADALVRLLAVDDPRRGLKLVERWPDLARLDVATAFADGRRVSRNDLVDLLASDTMTMRVFALRAGQRVLRRADVEPLLEDRSPRVRRAAVRLILDREWRVSADDLIAATYRGHHETLAPHTLRRRILSRAPARQLPRPGDRSGPAAPDVYAAAVLADFERFGEQVRADVDDDYAAWSDDEERRDAMRTAGVIALAARGTASDIIRLEPFLTAEDDPGSGLAVAAFFGRVGGPDEADVLLALGHQEGGEPLGVEDALDVIARRHPEVVDRLLASPNVDFRATGLRVAVDVPDPAHQDRIRSLLYDENWWIRKSAVAALVEILDEEGLKALLESYEDDSEKVYYYNVIGWLDRFLYAPEPFRTVYLQDLRVDSTPDA